MKIRTITTGFNLAVPLREAQIRKIAHSTNKAKRIFEDEGYTIQTVRMATQPWEEYFTSRDQMVNLVKELEGFSRLYHIDYFNTGTTRKPDNIPIVHDIIKSSSNGFCTVTISDHKEIDYEAARRTAALMKRLSKITGDGFANLRFAALFNTRPGSPFYPAAYHEGPTSFAIGTENSDLVYKAFSKARDIRKAGSYLKNMLTAELKKVEKIGEKIAASEKIRYNGIDVSIATSVKRNESIAYAFEKLGLGKFGEVGSLAIAKVITDTIAGLDVKKCGYSGLMLPVLEDYGLAKRNNEGTFNVTSLLLYSAVCGAGLDTIPVSGEVSEKKLYALLLDIGSLAIKLNKPLSARLMPVPSKKVGEMTEYRFQYFVNTKIMKV